MKKTIVTSLMILLISSVSIASEKQTPIEHSSQELITKPKRINPFCMAIVKGDIDTVKKMIEFGSDVNEESEGMTPLMYAARYNKGDIIKLLVKKGAKIKTKTNEGYTAIKFAKLSNATEAVAILEKLS